MEALTVGSPLTKFAPTFSLAGLSLTFDRPPIALGGAFLRVEQTQNGKTFDAYYGEVLVTVPQFSLNAVGGWAPTPTRPCSSSTSPSTRRSAARRSSRSPAWPAVSGSTPGSCSPQIDGVGTYALLPGPKAPKQPSEPAAVLSDVLPVLQSTFEVQAGQYWVAAGIAASSFEMITVQAVLSVGFGVDVQIGVVGTGSITLPTGEPFPVAYIEIDVVASYTPSTGVLSIVGKLSPASYLYGGFVKLTGGFALCAWFLDDPADKISAGDFVVTIGGYHPAFVKPDNYPVVPRLGISFSLGPIKVLGQAYIALTPGAFMAGIALQATFDAGPISAWFSAGLDFLIAWAPFHYEAHAWVAIGCKVDLGLFSLRIQIGADLQIWGPPFGGQAIVDLDVVSFTIAFGAPARHRHRSAGRRWPPTSCPAGQSHAPGLAVDASARTAGAGRLRADPPPTGWSPRPSPRAGCPPPPRASTGSSTAITSGSRSAARCRSTTRAGAPVPRASDELPNLVADYAREMLVRAIRAGGPRSRRRPAGRRAAQRSPAGPGRGDADLLRRPRSGSRTSTSHRWGSRASTPTSPSLSPSATRTGTAYSTYVTDLTVLPQLSSANAALWGDGGAASDVNGDRLVPSALVGLDLAPLPRHPDAINDVAAAGADLRRRDRHRLRLSARAAAVGVHGERHAERRPIQPRRHHRRGPHSGPAQQRIRLVRPGRPVGQPAASRRAGRAAAAGLRYAREQFGAGRRAGPDPAVGLAGVALIGQPS